MTENTTPLLSRFLETLSKKKKMKYAMQALFNTGRPVNELIDTVRGAAFAIPGFDATSATPDMFANFKTTKTAKLYKAGINDEDEQTLKNNMEIKTDVERFVKNVGRSPRRKLVGGSKKEVKEMLSVPNPDLGEIEPSDDDTDDTQDADLEIIEAPNLVRSVISGISGAMSSAAQGVANLVTSTTVDDAKQADVASSMPSSSSSEPSQGPSYGSSIPLPLEADITPEMEERSILLRKTEMSKAKQKLRRTISELEAASMRGELSQEGADVLRLATDRLSGLTNRPETLYLEKELDERIKQFGKANAEPRLQKISVGGKTPVLVPTTKTLANKQEFIDDYDRLVAAGNIMSDKGEAKYKRYKAEIEASRKKRVVPVMSEEQLQELEIQESARKRAKFAEAEQRTKAMPTRLELIQAARNGANMDPIPGIASGNVRGLVGNTATRRLARSAMYNPSGPDAVAFRSNQIYPGDSNNLNQGPGPRRQFAQQIPKGLNGQPSYEDAPTNARISPLVQSILVPNYTPPPPVQPGLGRLAQRAWDNYVQDIQAVSYASR